LRINDKDVVKRVGPHESIVILPGIPHLFKSVTDSMLLEYWSNQLIEDEIKFYNPYREKVMLQFKK
jgi:hypothetical protein